MSYRERFFQPLLACAAAMSINAQAAPQRPPQVPMPPPFQEYRYIPPLSANKTGFEVVAPGGGRYVELPAAQHADDNAPLVLRLARMLGLKKGGAQ